MLLQHSIVVHELVREPAARDQILGTTYALKLASGFCASVAVQALAGYGFYLLAPLSVLPPDRGDVTQV